MTIGIAIGLAAVACVGLIEWIKKFINNFFTIPGWAWSLAILAAAMLCGFFVVYGAGITAKTPLMAVLLGLVVLALAQIGYDAIIKAIADKAGGALDEKTN